MPLPRFATLAHHADPLADGIAAERGWAQAVAEGSGPQAHLWQGVPGWAVPASYARAPGWADWQARCAAAGTPVHVRSSGGGLVPQGPGLWNLSLLWRTEKAEPVQADAVYHALCALLARTLAAFGVEASAQPVEGAFCDGRYNLASGGRKLVGTAQAWRRVGGVPVVLAHAVLVLDADPAALTAATNAFEAGLGQPRRYRVEALTSVAAEALRAGQPGGDWSRRLAEALRAQGLAAIP
ncbi:lipoyl protein ligase domain-containing protein [Pseudorhodoferax sp.]|uniref:lipoyl protein ligase domain-containing protein n=1 Tax=Pseudorhodoferax sp. TaxID=1993553 RepID=UPI002DD67702|nr:lipoate--protein ligase [Pseudorhodoferax sp.]